MSSLKIVYFGVSLKKYLRKVQRLTILKEGGVSGGGGGMFRSSGGLKRYQNITKYMIDDFVIIVSKGIKIL